MHSDKDSQSASSKPTTEFAPRLSGVKGRSSPRERVQIWVCLFPYGQSLRWCEMTPAINQGRETNPNPNFLVRISLGGAGVFHVKGVGAKKFGMSLETREIKLFFGGISRDFGGISRDFGGISQGCPKSLRKKSLCSILAP